MSTPQNQMSAVDTLRIRYMKGEALLQAQDDFGFYEITEAMQTVSSEAKARALTPPIPVFFDKLA